MLLLGLLALQRGTFLLPLVEQIVLVPSHPLQFLVLVLYLALLCLHHLTLCALIGRIFADKSQTAVHLGKVLGAEYKHQLVLYCAVARHISHRLYIFSLAVLKLLFECGELIFQHAYVAVYMRDIFLYAFNRLLSLVDFAVYHHQIVEPFLNIGFIGTQKPLLLLNLALYACTLSAQSLD
ncbi:unknown [Prevotella sp. CAG:1185]|nr:unknown [Prevotella sp. CAG:1185]